MLSTINEAKALSYFKKEVSDPFAKQKVENLSDI